MVYNPHFANNFSNSIRLFFKTFFKLFFIIFIIRSSVELCEVILTVSLFLSQFSLLGLNSYSYSLSHIGSAFHLYLTES